MHLLTVRLHPVGVLLLGKSVVQRHLPQRPAIHKNHAPPVQIGGHVRLLIFDEQPIVQNIHRTERIVSLEILRIQFDLPHLDMRSLGRILVEFPEKPPTRTGTKGRNGNGCLDENRLAGHRFVADHPLRALSAHCRLYGFAIGPAMDQHPGSRCGQLRRRVDGFGTDAPAYHHCHPRQPGATRPHGASCQIPGWIPKKHAFHHLGAWRCCRSSSFLLLAYIPIIPGICLSPQGPAGDNRVLQPHHQARNQQRTCGDPNGVMKSLSRIPPARHRQIREFLSYFYPVRPSPRQS